MPSAQRKIFLIAFLAISLLSIGRLIRSHFDPSIFIVAGSDFVDSGKTPAKLLVQNGPGYDGQFFYRYALHPFNFRKEDNGVTSDNPSYRMQRLAYPLLVWVFSFGGNPGLVPLMMILVNMAAFLGIVFFTGKFIFNLNANPKMGYLPLFLCGIYMAFARDLSEVVELFFFTGFIYYLFKSDYLLLSLFATCSLFSRDTSLIVLVPLFSLLTVRELKTNRNVLHLLCLAFPFLAFASWKLIVQLNMPAVKFADGYQKMGIPFLGIIDGFYFNMDLSDTKHILEFLFWIAYLAWNSYLVILVFRVISFRKFSIDSNLQILNLAYLIWFVFALCITLAIYIDDWGFVRIFSLWNMLGFLILIANKKQTGKFFNYSSAILAALTIVRMMIRV